MPSFGKTLFNKCFQFDQVANYSTALPEATMTEDTI